MISRRAWLAGAARGAVVALMAAGPLQAAVVSDEDARAVRIARDTIAIDTHNHVDVAIMPDLLPQPDIDIVGAMRRSGLSAVCMVFALDYQSLANPADGYRRFMAGLASTDAQLKRNGIARSLDAADVRAAHRAHRPAVIQGIEGGHWLEGRVDRIAEAYGRGLRHFGLLHDHDATPPLGDTNTAAPRFGGLTRLGEDVIRECNRLGILVDLAHADAETSAAAVKAARAPVIFSHTGLNTRLGDDPEVAHALYGKLVSPEQARTIAQAGGVVGVWTHVSLTPQQYGRNVAAMVDVCGIDHVCIGTDTKLTPALGVGGGVGVLPKRRSIGGLTDDAWPDLRNGFYPAVVAGLLDAGFHPEEIGKIGGGNYLRVLAAAAGARA